MGLRERYLGAVSKRMFASAATAVCPSVLCQACVDVLPVEGAGISLTGPPLRVPLGWSSERVEIVERAETTLGAGPCLSAAGAGRTLAADAPTIARRWPVYWDELLRLTPFRSVASVPLSVHDELVIGALNLYASGTDLRSTLALDDVADDVAGPVTDLLCGMFEQLYGEDFDVPNWLTQDPAVERLAVWTAVGMLVAQSPLTDADALAMIRAWAYSRGRSLDEVAASVVNGDTPVARLLADA